MATRKAQVRLTGRFPVGTTVELREVAPGALPGGPPMGRVVSRAKTDRESVTVFEDGVQEGVRYQAVAEVDGVVRAVTVTGKVPAADKVRTARPPAELAGALEDPLGRDDFHEQEFDGDLPELEAPGNMPRQDQARGELQRSSTPVGVATPMDPDETVPHLAQRDFADGKVLQRSDTEHGMATPIPDRPVTQAEASAAGVWQASDTPVGTATPLRDGGPVLAKLAEDSPREKVGAERVEPAGGPSDADVREASRHEREQRLVELRGGLDPQDLPAPEDLTVEQLEAEVLEREAAAGEDPEEKVEPEDDTDDGEPAGEPWKGYDDAGAAELKEQIARKRSEERLGRALSYERANAGRSTVEAAIEARLAELRA
jgi:hypothetical protein